MHDHPKHIYYQQIWTILWRKHTEMHGEQKKRSESRAEKDKMAAGHIAWAEKMSPTTTHENLLQQYGQFVTI